MQRNSVTTEKGTWSTQCLYKTIELDNITLFCFLNLLLKPLVQGQNCKPSLANRNINKNQNKTQFYTNTFEAKYFLGHTQGVPFLNAYFNIYISD